MARKTTPPDAPEKPARSRKAPVKAGDIAKAVAPKKPAAKKAAKKAPARTRRPAQKAPAEIDQPDNGMVTVEPPAQIEDGEKLTDADKSAILEQFAKLDRRWQIFIEAYVTAPNATAAAIKAGYSPANAANTGSKLMNDPRVKPIIDFMLAEHLHDIAMSRERVLGEIEAMAKADQNELVELRRVCCRYCHGGPEFNYMETPAEHRKRVKRYEDDCLIAATVQGPMPEFDETIVIGFNGTLAPNPDCPECWGEGVERVFFKDTRYLSDGARALYAGAHWGKDGLKVNTYSKDSALDRLAKHHKLYEDKTEVNLIMPSTDELDAIYAEAMEKTKAATEKVVGRSGRIGTGGE